MEEIWKDVKGYEGLYKVSNLGRVLGVKSNKIRHFTINNKGYCLVALYKDAVENKVPVHRIVAEAFIQNPDNLPQVNHIDCNKQNNKVNNLEWCDQHYNYKEGMKNFLYSHNENHYFAKLTNKVVKCIPTLYRLGFIRQTVAKILGITVGSVKAIEKGISYRELGLDFRNIKRQKYKDLPNIKLPSYIWNIFKDNTVLNTLIAEGKVSV